MNKKLAAIRGATGALNTKESITENVCQLFNQVVEKNQIKAEDMVSLQFTMTKDLNVLNPATALRLGKVSIDVTEVALFCSQEAEITGGAPLMIRMMLTTYMDENLKKTNIYINGGEKLRPDYAKQI